MSDDETKLPAATADEGVEPAQTSGKHDRSESSEDEAGDNDGWIGPMPTEAAPVKKQKVLHHERLYLDNLPDSECYEKSYMHRDLITHICATRTDFVITASCDGHVKFWKKQEEGIEFVKHFRSHLLPIHALAANHNGHYLCSASADRSCKIFDIVNFDMINMLRLDYVPQCAEWTHSVGDPIALLAVSEAETGRIHVYDGKGTAEPLHTFATLHSRPVCQIRYNVAFEVAVSIDRGGMLEYWGGAKLDYSFPAKLVAFESKMDTGLYEFAKCKTTVSGLAFTPDGRRFATMSTDRKVRVFQFLTGKLIRVFDETLARFTDGQQLAKQAIPNMEFGRRMANERELEKGDQLSHANIVFDDSGHFLLYPTMIGVKLINVETNRCVKIIGKGDNLRPLYVALFQGRAKKAKAAITLEQEASTNPTLLSHNVDPTIFCTAYKKQRFYMYTRRLPSDLQEIDRDVFNEKPSKEDIIAVPEGQGEGVQRIYNSATLHTTKGDVHMKLFAAECPKTVENFCVHSKNGYYNGHIFHRVIKGFMVQTGDPTGTGTGGQSIWGGDFKDEFVSTLKHDRPYTMSMANAGPNTNGSQFFITVLPTQWLDNKHTVFGRVVRGMEVVQNICNAKTNPKTDKPYDEIKIISINLS